MKKNQRNHLATRLREERARAVQALDRYHRKLSDPDGDAGTDTFDPELAAQEAFRLSRELSEIDAALERLYLTPERYGRDERTGKEMPFERLDVIPWARTGVERG